MEYEQQDEDDFSMSSYDGEQGDSLVIKPPQAVVQKKDKREKRERRDRHRHKGSHKERHKSSREHRSRDERREHRRHRDRDGSRREGRKHEKHREKAAKREGHSGDPHGKLDRERKLHHEREPSQMDRHRMEREIYIESRSHEMRGSREHARHREKRVEEHLYESMEDFEISPQEETEKDRRMQKFLLAEKQKQLSQRDADARRQKREEEKKEEMRIEELRQRAEASMYRRTKRPSDSPPPIEKRPKLAHTAEIPETVEIISDDEMNESGEIREDVPPEPERSERSASRGRSTPESGAENEPGETESSSDSSSDDEEDDSASNDDDRESDRSGGRKSRENSLTPASSIDEEARTPTHDYKASEELPPLSPQKSPVVLKEILPPYYPAIMGCRSVDEFECLNRIEEGTYGVVYRAREKSTDEIVALKRLKMEKEKEGFPITSLREVNTLLKGQHENIVTVREIVVGSNIDKIYIVMDYVEHDLKSLMETMRGKKQKFTVAEVKALMIQLMKAVHHLHDNWILHRDLKTSNLLLSHRGVLKVGDFGLAREYGSPLKQYTPVVVTLWYRAPELLLGTKEYSCAIDVWSVGCIFGELLGMEPMFPGKSEIDQINKIFKELGSPNEKIWPGYGDFPVVKKTTFGEFPYNHLRERFKERLSDEGFNLLNKFLTYNPSKRITCADGLEHAYFTTELPAPVDPAMFPTWPAKSEQGRIKKDSPKPPSGGKNFKDLGKGEDEHMASFFYLGGVPKGAGFQLK